jgi:stage V sporulation protein B
LQVDTLLLGRFLSDRAQDAAVTIEQQRAAVKAGLAIYRECQTFAFLPYQLLFSVTLVRAARRRGRRPPRVAPRVRLWR